MPANDETIEVMAGVVRRIVSRELTLLDAMPALSDDDVDRLAKLALVLQRIRVPANAASSAIDPENPATTASDESLMRKAAQ